MRYPATLLSLLLLLPVPCTAADSTALTPFDVTCPSGVDPGCHPDWSHGTDVTSGKEVPSDGWLLYRRDSAVSRSAGPQSHSLHVGKDSGAMLESWTDISRSADSGSVMVPVKKGWSFGTSESHALMPNRRIIFYPCLGTGSEETPAAPAMTPSASDLREIVLTEDSGSYTESRDVLDDAGWTLVGGGSMRIEWDPLTAAQRNYISMSTSSDGRTVTVTLKNSSDHVQMLSGYKAPGTAGKDFWSTQLTYRYIDSGGNSSTGHLPVQVRGKDDKPAIGSYTHAVTEDGGKENTKSSTNPKVSGNVLADAKVGNGRTSLRWGTSTSTYGTWKTDASGNYTYTLNNASTAVQQLGKKQSVTEKLFYTWNDESGQSASGSVTVTIKGTADNPSLSKTTYAHSLAEDGGTYTASGNVLAAGYDPGDGGAVLKVSSKTSVYGTWSFSTTTGAYSYRLSNSSSAVQALGSGQTVTDRLVFTYTDRDSCRVVTGSITVTISGKDEVPSYGYRLYTSGSGTFTVPAGANRLRVTCVGGGSGGVVPKRTADTRATAQSPASVSETTTYKVAGTASVFGGISTRTTTDVVFTQRYDKRSDYDRETFYWWYSYAVPDYVESYLDGFFNLQTRHIVSGYTATPSRGSVDGAVYTGPDPRSGPTVEIGNYLGTVIAQAGSGGNADNEGKVGNRKISITGAAGYSTVRTLDVTPGQRIAYSVGTGGPGYFWLTYYDHTMSKGGEGGSPGGNGAILVEWGRGIE